MIHALKHDMQVVLNIDSDLSIYVVVFSIQRCPNIGKIGIWFVVEFID